MAILYRELRFLLSKMREVRKLPEAEIPAWSEQAGQDWAYLHLPHY